MTEKQLEQTRLQKINPKIFFKKVAFFLFQPIGSEFFQVSSQVTINGNMGLKN